MVQNANLRAHDDGIELAADPGCRADSGNAAAGRGREAVVELAMQVVKQKPKIGVWIPVQPDGVDRLVGRRRRRCFGSRVRHLG